MPEFSSWTRPLQGCLLAQVCPRPEMPDIRAVRFARHWDGPDAEALWLGDGPELLRLLDGREDLAGLTFFSAGDAEGLLAMTAQRGVNLAVADLDLLDLHERLSAVLRRYQDWSVRLLEAAGRRHSIQDVVDTAAALAGGSLFLLNTGCRVVYFGGHACLDAPPAREMLEQGLLSPVAARDLLGDHSDAPSPSDLLYRALGSDGCCWVQRVFKDQSLISHMVLFAPADRRDLDARTLLGLVRDSVSRVAAGNGPYWAGADFKVLLTALLTGKLNDEEEIRRRFSLISRIPQEFCSFVVIEPSAPKALPAAPSALLAQLEALFPESNAALYDNGIVLLLSRPDRDFQPAPTFDRARFQALLTQYDAYASISNATSRRAMLRTNYLLAKGVLQLGRALRRCASQRVFFFEEYAEYLMIDLCLQSFSALLGHDDIIYLTHPDVVKLYRYDVENRSNLLDVAYYYCLNSCSISQAAKAAYMHRNTFAARLAKIQELIQADLSDGEIRQRMVCSCKVLRYYDRYAKINLGKRLGAAAQGERK